MLKFEIVVRSYLTGSTSTSIWVNYERGQRSFCGNALPDGMRKNQELDDIQGVRLWLKSQGYVGDDGPQPAVTDDARLMLAEKYVHLYERMTGEDFEIPEDADVLGRISRNLASLETGTPRSQNR
jgi:hypothetical protein